MITSFVVEGTAACIPLMHPVPWYRNKCKAYERHISACNTFSCLCDDSLLKKVYCARDEGLDLYLIALPHQLCSGSMSLPDVLNYVFIAHFVFIATSWNKASAVNPCICMPIIFTSRETLLVQLATRIVFFLVLIVLRAVLKPDLTVSALLPVVCAMCRTWR